VLKEEGELLEGIFDIRNRRVHEIMTPRPEIVWVAKGTTVSGLLSVFSEASHSRFPVYEGDHDNIAGFISVKDVLKALGEGRLTMDSPIDSLLRPAFFVPETKEVGKLFVEMQQEGHPMALVVDEYGGISGLVTIKMLLEEMVGPLGEEWAKPEKEFEAIDERTFEVDAGMTIYDANDELGLDIPEGQYETVAGFVLSQLGHIPEQGEQFVYDGWRLTVSEIKGVKIERVLLTRLEVATPDSAARRAS
jgi:CBS domain containing-hemolysin-like protein